MWDDRIVTVTLLGCQNCRMMCRFCDFWNCHSKFHCLCGTRLEPSGNLCVQQQQWCSSWLAESGQLDLLCFKYFTSCLYADSRSKHTTMAPPVSSDSEEMRPKITYATVSEKYGLEPSEVAACELKPFRTLPGSTILYDEVGVKRAANLKQVKLEFEKQIAPLKAAIFTAEANYKYVESETTSSIRSETKKLIQRTADDSEQCEAFQRLWHGGVKKYKPSSSSTNIPSELWETILKHLCSDLEHDGVRSVSAIARDIINASMASKDLYAAALPALKHLSTNCQMPPPGTEHLWDKFVSDPCSMALEDIKVLAKHCELGLSQPNRSLIFLIMDGLSLQHPTRAPARIVKNVADEKRAWAFSHYVLCPKTDPWKYGASDFAARKGCTDAGIQTLAELFEVEGEPCRSSYQRLVDQAAVLKSMFEGRWAWQ